MNPKVQEMLEDPGFAQILEKAEPFFHDAPSFYQWEPPNGETICLLTNIKTSAKQDDRLKEEVAVVRVTVEIQQGELEGKSFDLSGTYGWTPRNFVGLKTLASILQGEPILDFIPALSVLYDNVGSLLRVSTTRTPRQSGDGVWVNHRVLEKMESDEAEVLAEESPPETSPEQ